MLLPVTLIAASLFAAAGDSPSAYLAAARKALELRNIQEAKKQLGLALQANPQMAEAWLMLAGAEIENGETGPAIEHYQHALRLAPESFTGHYDLALAYLHERKLTEARHELEYAVKLDPRQPDAAYNLGMVLLELRDAGGAVKSLRGARAIQPDRPDIAFNLIRAELASGDWAGARKARESSSPSFAADAAWQASVGKLFLESGHPQDAVPALRQAFQLQPAAVEVRDLLASAYVQSRQPDLALALIPVANTADEHFLRGSALLVERRVSEAESEAASALSEKPQEPQYLLLGARVQQTEGHQDAAVELLRRAAEQAPESAEPYYSMAVSYYFEHRYEQSRDALAQSLKRSPDAPGSLFLFAVTLVNQGNNREAEKYLQRAIALQPDNSRYWLHLGTVRFRNGNAAAAREAFLRAVQLKPDYALPHYELGKLLAHSDARTALEELQKAVTYEPGLAQAYYQLSRVAAALGQKEKSEQALATFNRLKKHEEGEERTLTEDVNGELQHP